MSDPKDININIDAHREETTVSADMPSPPTPIAPHQLPEQHPRTEAPGIHVTPPPSTDAEWDAIQGGLLEAERLLIAVRRLFRNARKARADASYPALRDQLCDLRARLYEQIAPIVRRIEEIDRYL